MPPPSLLASDLTIARWDEAVARRVLTAWRASGMTPAEFERAHGVQAQRLRHWRRILGEPVGRRREPERGAVAPVPAFVPAVVHERSAGSAAIVVRLPGGVDLAADSTEALPPSWVAALARALGAP